jgi:hypothetical protein
MRATEKFAVVSRVRHAAAGMAMAVIGAGGGASGGVTAPAGAEVNLDSGATEVNADTGTTEVSADV